MNALAGNGRQFPAGPAEVIDDLDLVLVPERLAAVGSSDYVAAGDGVDEVLERDCGILDALAPLHPESEPQPVTFARR